MQKNDNSKGLTHKKGQRTTQNNKNNIMGNPINNFKAKQGKHMEKCQQKL